MPGLRERWLELCLDLSMEPARIVVGTRKVLRSKTWVISGDDWRKGDFNPEKIVGYTNWPVKQKQLHRYYVNPEEIKRGAAKYAHIRDVLQRFDSVNVTLKNEHKHGWTAQDHCMASMVVSYWPAGRKEKGFSEIDVYYRTTEVAKKFVADLALFREDIFPLFEPFNKIRFIFSTLNMSVAFTPAIFLSVPDPIDFLEQLRASDERHWRRICSYLIRYLCLDEEMKFKQHDRVKTKLLRDIPQPMQMKIKSYLHAKASLMTESFQQKLKDHSDG